MNEVFFAAGDLSGLPDRGLAVVGFSGGADSTALVHWLKGKIEPSRMVLAHLNHMLRGEEAEHDEACVREFSRKMGLRLVVSRQDIKALARERGMGLEECGRAARYAFFQSLVTGEDDRILTAHTADDNAETILLNLCRGTGLSGLCGIPRQRGNILRPLLSVSREEIEAYCKHFDLPFVTDSTNLTAEFARNKVRLEVLPVLKELNPRVIQTIGQTALLLERDRQFLKTEGEKLLIAAQREYGLSVAVLQDAEEALQRTALRLWLGKNGCTEPKKKHLDALLLCSKQGGTVSLPGNLTARCAQGVLSLSENREAQPFSLTVSLSEQSLFPKKIPLPDGRTLLLEEKPVEDTKNSGKEWKKVHNLLFQNAVDYDIILANLAVKELIVRTRREGDRFSPAGRKVTKSLKQVFQERGMPPDFRRSAVLLELGGELIFCQGAGAAEGFQVTEKTRRALFVTVLQGQNEE
ncbi:MAG: tRNA lysidine(34) synthetase TilS [Acutalibacter sp.]|nr:tRNA lysidine(34) synthetase TilS [Acutalibacter sp.]